MFLGIQLVVMALLSRDGYQKRVSYFIRIFRKPDTDLFGWNDTTAGIHGGDVYADLPHLSKSPNHGDDMPYCPKTSPFISEFSFFIVSNKIVFSNCHYLHKLIFHKNVFFDFALDSSFVLPHLTE